VWDAESCILINKDVYCLYLYYVLLAIMFEILPHYDGEEATK
jgi:hypothetical protein